MTSPFGYDERQARPVARAAAQAYGQDAVRNISEIGAT
jgi:hypothetical protein